MTKQTMTMVSRAKQVLPGTRAVEGTLVEKTVRTIIEYIHNGKMKLGDELLSEAQFSEKLGVSRTVIREAFGALAALKLIDVGGGRRARIRSPDHTVMSLTLNHAVLTEQMTIQQIWDVRRSLEIRTVALAAAQRTDEEARTIMRYAKEMRRATSDISARVDYDVLLHQEIAKATRNALFFHIISSFDLITKTTVTYLEKFRKEETELSLTLHERIAEGIAERDPDKAMAAMNDHFDMTFRKLMYAGFY